MESHEVSITNHIIAIFTWQHLWATKGLCPFMLGIWKINAQSPQLTVFKIATEYNPTYRKKKKGTKQEH